MLDGFLSRLGEPTTVIEDATRAGIFDTAMRAWSAYDPSADWHIVFQDDMWAQSDALPRMRDVLTWVSSNIGHALISFFQPAVGPIRVIREYIAPWVTGGEGLVCAHTGTILWGGTIAVPTKLVPQMVSDIERLYPPRIWNQADDEKICFWSWRRNLPAYCYAPSLLEHVGWNASVTPGNDEMSDFWRRGLLLADEADRSDPVWQTMIDSVTVVDQDGVKILEANPTYDMLKLERKWP